MDRDINIFFTSEYDNMKPIIDNFRGEFAFLSNFCHVPNGIFMEGVQYSTVEHAYQAAKTLDVSLRELIRGADTPGKAKQLGNQVALRVNWDDIKLQIMYDLLIQKFKHPEFKKALLLTGSSYLCEGNTWHDTYWGVCHGIGKNNLGKLLMKIRRIYEKDSNLL